MLAVSVLQESQAIARVVVRQADPHVVQFAKSQAMHLESSTADVASNLPDDVMRDLFADRDADNDEAVLIFRSNDANRPGSFRAGHARIIAIYGSIGKRCEPIMNSGGNPMQRVMFKSKIHRATVTAANLDYEGSLTVDADLLDASDILPFEQIHVWDVSNGARLVTYALPGKRGSGEICVNGAGAHLIKPGDLVIVATYAAMTGRKAKRYQPTIVLVDEANRIKQADDPQVVE